MLIYFLLFVSVAGLENGLARLPPMGWMSWTRFYCQIDCERHPFSCINEYLYKSHADRLALDGYLEVGYDRIHIDDCWANWQRDGSGKMVENKTRFPSGMKGMADYIHKLGLKFGSYGDYGSKTCAGYPGSMNYEKIDAFTFASDWEVDYVKLDGCNANADQYKKGYPLFGKYLNQTGRPVVYSCSWPAYIDDKKSIDYKTIVENCNLWRNYQDIASSWDSLLGIIQVYVRDQDQLIPIHGPGHWNDPDMLIVGNPGVSLGTSRVQMAVWSIWSAPLIMSNDLRIIPQEFADLLKNTRVIAVNQDPLGIMGRMVKKTPQLWYFVKPMTPVSKDGKQHSYAIAVVNYSRHPAKFEFTLGNFNISSPNGFEVQELFLGQKLGHHDKNTVIQSTLPVHDAYFIKATIVQ
ncbi:unnamed protein product [Bursaphelenchus okinawaensis]|uniref:Alpha-galactosidase n=1 Tax=Bursaphelenchus okinawaensis TaxID=465554 RepID=A0A811L8D7_9BILA|nr:unnamed protein product [Bursaphelenchus okinawaensis]CAG9119842.1 unnamed protein product [Bursaphelenchus okinawaensis]